MNYYAISEEHVFFKVMAGNVLHCKAGTGTYEALMINGNSKDMEEQFLPDFLQIINFCITDPMIDGGLCKARPRRLGLTLP